MFRGSVQNVNPPICLLHCLQKGRGKNEKKKLLQHLVTHLSNNPVEQGLTLLSGRDAVLSSWHSYSTLNAFFFISRFKFPLK